MTVLVVQVGSVRMVVRLGFVPVRMAVLAGEWRIVRVMMMTVVVAMNVLVLDWLVRVLVPVLFGQVQVNGEREQEGRRGQWKSPYVLAHRGRQGRPDEGRDGEDRCRSARADFSLRSQVKAKADAESRGANGQKGDRATNVGKSLARQERQREPEAGADEPLVSDDRGRIEIRERTRQGIVDRPRQGRDHHGPCTGAQLSPLAPADQTCSSGEHQGDGRSDAATDWLVKPQPADEDREHRLEVQKQRRRRAIDMLEAPGQARGGDQSAGDANRQEPRHMGNVNRRLARRTASAHYRRNRSSCVKPGGNRNRPCPSAHPLDERRGDAEQEGCQKREETASTERMMRRVQDRRILPSAGNSRTLSVSDLP
jgi:hypothetical protein